MVPAMSVNMTATMILRTGYGGSQNVKTSVKSIASAKATDCDIITRPSTDLYQGEREYSRGNTVVEIEATISAARMP